MGTKVKKYVFNGLRSPQPRVKKTVEVMNDPKKWLITDNYDVTFNDLVLVTNHTAGVAVVPTWRCPEKTSRRVAPDANLVREIWPRQSVWQRVPSWLVKLETENGVDETNRVYKLVQCEKNAGMQAIVTEEALTLGKGTYRLSFEAAADVPEKEGPLELLCRVQANDWMVERQVSVADGWTACSVSFDLPIETPRDDLVGVMILSTRPVETLRLRGLRFTRETEGKRGAIAFTFDDGTVDQYEVAAPVLDKYGIKAIFNGAPQGAGRGEAGRRRGGPHRAGTQLGADRAPLP